MNIIEKAKLFATVAHGATGQKRKHSGLPYISHPQDIVNILHKDCFRVTRTMIAAAWLHDVVEDTGISIDFIFAEFGDEVGDLVKGLTNERPESMNRLQRHAHNVARINLCSKSVKTVKIADSIANMRNVVVDDPKFAPIYIAEKRTLLDEALVGGCPALWVIADNIIKNYLAVKPLDQS